MENSRGDLVSCWVKFPDQTSSVPYNVNPQNITYDTNGYDVAYISLSNYSQIRKEGDPYMLLDRTKKDVYACKNPLKIGDSVLMLGYPVYGTSITTFELNPIEVTATEGIISGKDSIYYTTSAKIDHGNSGGLAIDKNNDCYFGTPTWNEAGSFESLGRILPASIFLSY